MCGWRETALATYEGIDAFLPADGGAHAVAGVDGGLVGQGEELGLDALDQLVRVAAGPRTPTAFAAAWAELAMDKAKATGPFAAAIPKTNLAKAISP